VAGCSATGAGAPAPVRPLLMLEKAHSGRVPMAALVHSFRGPLSELATLTTKTVRLHGSEVTFEKLALPTPVQAEALRLPGLSPSL
jgi:hypothetical protein